MSHRNPRDPRWTPFLPARYPPEKEEILRRVTKFPYEVWKNNLYEVQLRRMEPQDGWPAMIWLSIKRIDREPIDYNHWRTLQRIKNLLVGLENEAVELFPAESRLADTSNQYHLFCFADPSVRFPFGFNERLVGEKSSHGAKQRPWSDDERPADLMDEQIHRDMDKIFQGGTQ